MADSKPERKDMKKKHKKRKIRTSDDQYEEEEEVGPSKASRVEGHSAKENEETDQALEYRKTSEILQFGSPWRNLQLILSLQDKEIDRQRKVELAYAYVKSRVNREGDDNSQVLEAVSISRVIVFLNNWVQSLLISSEKRSRVEGSKLDTRTTASCLDCRCWEVFSFCLEESLKRNVSLSFSRDFLRVIHCFAGDALSRISAARSLIQSEDLDSDVFNFYNTVLGCISCIFRFHGGISNENLDLWVLTVEMVLQLDLKILEEKLGNSKMGIFVLQFSCVMIEPFTRFLRVHPTRKNGFHDFVNKLLEPLLCLLDGEHLCTHTSNLEWRGNFLKSIQEVLSLGLFHPTHIDGFISVQSLSKYKTSDYGNQKDLKMVVKSYHRHLFEKLEKIMTGTNALALGAIGELFHLYVECVKKQKGIAVGGEGSEKLEDDLTGEIFKSSLRTDHVVTENSNLLNAVNSETRKSLFDFFVQMMEPLLAEIHTYLQDELEGGNILLLVNHTIKAINSVLVSFMHENLYVRTEDTSEGACVNFLKVIFDTIMSLSAKSNTMLQSFFDLEKETEKESVSVIIREIAVAIQCLLEIEYEVVGNDLEGLWLMMISLGAFGFKLDNSELSTLEIIHLGCQLNNLYSELRQVGYSVFALCKAVKRLFVSVRDVQMCHSSLYYESCANFVGMLLCSDEFRLSTHNAIKSIPEGQASGLIRLLTADISESINWVKGNCSMDARTETGNVVPDCSLPNLKLRGEVLGRGLCELYTLILDSVTVTTGNSTVIGVAVKELMAVIHPNMSHLVGFQPDGIYGFLSVLFGRTINKGNDFKHVLLSTYWVLLFFFRLYMSARALYRQVIGLVSPDTSKKMSEKMHDPFTAYSGQDWLERTGGTDEGYFSWIIQPSPSLLTIIKVVLQIYIEDSVADCSSLIYVLTTMAFQRLVDLNRLIKSFEYLLLLNDISTHSKSTENTSLSLQRKKIRKWRRHVSDLKEEAAELTNFIMEYVSLVNNIQPSISSSGDVNDTSGQSLPENEAWDFCVGAINEKSLPTAIWWILCQNVDVWCVHASKKKLKRFLSLLIHGSLSNSKSRPSVLGKHNTAKPGHMKTVTTNQISFELLTNAVLYEQSVVRKYMASRICKILEKLVSPIFKKFGEVHLKTLPNWSEVLDSLESSLFAASANSNVVHDYSSTVEQVSYASSNLPSFQVEVEACQRLIKFLCWMPKGYLGSRSLSKVVACILNLERLLLGNLINFRDASQRDEHCELFRLFMSCRKTLKNLTVASEEKSGSSHSSFTVINSESSFPTLWLIKSLFAVIELQHTFPDDCAAQTKEMIVSLMDHTSYVFLRFSKDQFLHAIHLLMYSGKPSGGKPKLSVTSNSNMCEANPCFDSSNDSDAWNPVVVVVETLRGLVHKFLIPLKEPLSSGNVEACIGVQGLEKLSSIVSCFQGLLWGLASALDEIDRDKWNSKLKLLRWQFEPLFRLNLCVETYANLISFFLKKLFFEDDKLLQNSPDAEDNLMPEDCVNLSWVEESSSQFVGAAYNSLYEREQQNSPDIKNFSSSKINDEIAGSLKKIKFRRKNKDVASFLAEIDLFDQQCLRRSLLLGFMRGENLEKAIFLRQLFIAYASVIKLNLHTKNNSLSASLVPVFVGISEVLLLEFADTVKLPDPHCFVCLDGIVKFLEELGSHFPLANDTLTKNAYTKLINLHLRAIGKCISLQGKRATLASHETESSTKTLNGQVNPFESSSSCGPYCVDELKARLRMSFRVFIEKSSEMHLFCAIQSIERVLVGVTQGCITNYEVCTGSLGGGKVSSVVAAGIDCLDLVLEYVKGSKRLSVVKRYMQGLVASLFNVILHLQGANMFRSNAVPSRGNDDPDPGSVILMSIEVLIRVFGKHAIFQMDSCYVSQCLRIPGGLFQTILLLKNSKALDYTNSLRVSDSKGPGCIESINSYVVDRRFSVELYAGCCRLLCTVLKHHKSESQHCIAVLEDAVYVLLCCLEMVDVDPAVKKDYFSWKIPEGVKCAHFLRRIYEEIRQQKEVYGRHCVQFFCNYIWIYSGYGPLKKGIKREIDEALRPGIYALIDGCSAENLQHIHTVFGEGPCRSTLASLQHDYKLNFQYEGKV